ncbi:MAG: DotI/IcmL family type IV secretion protein, partial [Deltaproteobacteria bacterium]|nr:DotI/IcmL family type IV secretion protein [Deltaproteobacteria bacterium]
FLNWRRQLNDVRNEFDPDGFASFVRSLSDGGHITKIERQRLNLTAVMESAPVLVDRAEDKGRQLWKVELPVLVSFQSSEGIISNQRLLAEITAMTVPRSQNLRGAVIRQIVLSKAD